MPIFRKDGQRILFVHIPKTAGSSLYLWFQRNNYAISNLELAEEGTGASFRSEFGIEFLPVEGIQPDNIAVQHATNEVWQQWGLFDLKFSLIRDPYQRWQSIVKYYYSKLLDHVEAEHSEAMLDKFRELFIKDVQLKYPLNKNMLSNHLRPQADFLAADVRLIRFDENWQTTVANDFQLEGPAPHEKQSGSAHGFELNEHEREFVYSHFAKDFEVLFSD